MPDVAPQRAQRRREADAVVLGLAATLGTGVFLVFAPAAGLAGSWLPLSIVLAGLVALLAAVSYADLAARYPGPGGGYSFVREGLTPCLGRLAGVAALFGRAASAAAAARVFGEYVLPGHPLELAVPLIVVFGGLASAGLRWTVRAAWVLVAGLLLVLAVVVVTGLTRHVPPDWAVPGMPGNGLPGIPGMPGAPGNGGGNGLGNGLGNGIDGVGGAPPAGPVPLAPPVAVSARHPVTPLGVLSAAGLVFFAFAGFAASVEGAPEAAGKPAAASRAGGRTRLVIPVLLLVVLVVYLAVAAALVHALDVARLAMESAPLVIGVGGAEAPALGVLVRVGAAAATACALFGVLAGASRTVTAMAVHRDLPRWLGPLDSPALGWRSNLPGVAGAVLVAALAGPVRAVALCACAALVHYALVSVAALRLPAGQRRWPRWTSALGLVLCLALAALLPRTPVLIAVSVLLAGWLVSALWSRRLPPAAQRPRVPRPRGPEPRPARRPTRSKRPDEPSPPVRGG
jgi:APA family basic amino acid/polyamine antiporter